MVVSGWCLLLNLSDWRLAVVGRGIPVRLMSLVLALVLGLRLSSHSCLLVREGGLLKASTLEHCRVRLEKSVFSHSYIRSRLSREA